MKTTFLFLMALTLLQVPAFALDKEALKKGLTSKGCIGCHSMEKLSLGDKKVITATDLSQLSDTIMKAEQGAYEFAKCYVSGSRKCKKKGKKHMVKLKGEEVEKTIKALIEFVKTQKK